MDDFDFGTMPRLNPGVTNAQIVSVDLERINRFVPSINGIPQKPARVADMHVRFTLRIVEGASTVNFDLCSTDGSKYRAWAETGTDGLIEEVFGFFKVNSLSKLKGRIVRVLTGGERIWAIGEYLCDSWLTRLGHHTSAPGQKFFYGITSGTAKAIADHHGYLHQVRESYYPGFANARIKSATLLPARDNAMMVVVKLDSIEPNSAFGRRKDDPAEIVLRFYPKTMEKLTELLDALCATAGLASGSFERLGGRLVRANGMPLVDISCSSMDREAARHYFIRHPVANHSVDIADYAGSRETVPA
jgi:hypothetical protein